MKIDCLFMYFKPSGKYYAEGVGQFPNVSGEIDRQIIKDWNDGRLPGIMGEAKEFVIIVIPQPDCESSVAYPRMIKETRMIKEI